MGEDDTGSKVKKRQVWQKHHISYDPEIIIKVTRGEHWLLTQLNRHKNPSPGLRKALDVWVALHGDE